MTEATCPAALSFPTGGVFRGRTLFRMSWMICYNRVRLVLCQRWFDEWVARPERACEPSSHALSGRATRQSTIDRALASKHVNLPLQFQGGIAMNRRFGWAMLVAAGIVLGCALSGYQRTDAAPPTAEDAATGEQATDIAAN